MDKIKETFAGLIDKLFANEGIEVRKTKNIVNDDGIVKHESMSISYQGLNFKIDKNSDGKVVYYFLGLLEVYKGETIELFSAHHRGQGKIKDIWDRCEEIIETNQDTDIMDITIFAPYDAVIYFLNSYKEKNIEI